MLGKKYESPFKVHMGNSLGLENFDRCFTELDPRSPEREGTFEGSRHLSGFSFETESFRGKEAPEGIIRLQAAFEESFHIEQN